MPSRNLDLSCQKYPDGKGFVVAIAVIYQVLVAFALMESLSTISITVGNRLTRRGVLHRVAAVDKELCRHRRSYAREVGAARYSFPFNKLGTQFVQLRNRPVICIVAK